MTSLQGKLGLSWKILSLKHLIYGDVMLARVNLASRGMVGRCLYFCYYDKLYSQFSSRHKPIKFIFLVDLLFFLGGGEEDEG